MERKNVMRWMLRDIGRSQVTKKQYNIHLFSFSFLAHVCLKTNIHRHTHHIEIHSDEWTDIRIDTGVDTR